MTKKIRLDRWTRHHEFRSIFRIDNRPFGHKGWVELGGPTGVDLCFVRPDPAGGEGSYPCSNSLGTDATFRCTDLRLHCQFSDPGLATEFFGRSAMHLDVNGKTLLSIPCAQFVQNGVEGYPFGYVGTVKLKKAVCIPVLTHLSLRIRLDPFLIEKLRMLEAGWPVQSFVHVEPSMVGELTTSLW